MKIKRVRFVGIFIVFIIGFGCNGNNHLEVIQVKSDCSQSSLIGTWIGSTSKCIGESDNCLSKITATINKDIFKLNCDAITLVSGENNYLGHCHGQIYEDSLGEVVRYDYLLSGSDSLQLRIECRSFSCEYLLKRDILKFR